METSRKYKWALSGLIIMVVLNAVILVSIWMDRSDARNWHKQRNNDRDRNSSQQFMKEELGLTEEQSDKITALRREHFGEIRSIKNDLDETRQSYFDYILMNDDHDPEMRDSLVNVLTLRYTEIEESLYVHMQNIREILDKEQAERFKDFMQKHTHKDDDRKKRKGRN